MMATLKQIIKAANLLVEYNVTMVKAEEALKAAKERSRVLREETIPNMMLELSIKDLTLDSGQKLTLSQEVYASIPVDKADAAFSWLNKHGFGGIIKTEVKTEYGKGERALAEKLAIELCDRGLNTIFKESVHTSTLKAFLKEQIRDGKKCPMDLFGARPVMVAKIK